MSHSSYPNVSAIRDRSRVFEQIAALDYNGAWAIVGRTGTEITPLRLGIVAGDLFGTLGVPPTIGRALTSEDDRIGAAPVAVISEGLWRRRFAGDSAIIGKSLSVWSSPYTIVGVMPGDFDLPAGAEAWVTVERRPPGVGDPEGLRLLRPGGTASPGIHGGRRQDRARPVVSGDESRCLELPTAGWRRSSAR